MTGAPHEQIAEMLNVKRQQRRIKWTVVARELGITVQHLLRIRQGTSPISDDVAFAIDDFLELNPGETRQLATGEAPAAVRHEWSADERAKILAMSFDEIVEFGRRLKEDKGEHAAVLWINEATRLKAEVLSPEDSPL